MGSVVEGAVVVGFVVVTAIVVVIISVIFSVTVVVWVGASVVVTVFAVVVIADVVCTADEVSAGVISAFFTSAHDVTAEIISTARAADTILFFILFSSYSARSKLRIAVNLSSFAEISRVPP